MSEVSEVTYPIAETFYSLQGEGTWAGTPMFFVRLAGCNVGEYNTMEPSCVKNGDFRLYQTNAHSVCTSILGSRFLCDTDYHMSEKMTIEELHTLIEESGADHVCLTGGEPFLHDLEPFLEVISDIAKIHIETSGTKPIFVEYEPWVTCSPKKGFLESNVDFINEWKILVDASTTADEIDAFVEDSLCPVFLQPIGGIHTLDDVNTKHAIELVKANPQWRLSLQMHKYWGLR